MFDASLDLGGDTVAGLTALGIVDALAASAAGKNVTTGLERCFWDDGLQLGLCRCGWWRWVC